jgi:phosphohistidine phosphatase
MSGLRLILMRHGEAATSGPAGDHSRPLTTHGMWEAGNVGRQLSHLGWVPQWAATSNAARAIQTWEQVSHSLPATPHAADGELYLAGLETIAGVALLLPDGVDTLLIVGHNPGLQDAASSLSGMSVGLRTAHAALLASPARRWASAFDAPWQLETVLRAKGA